MVTSVKTSNSAGSKQRRRTSEKTGRRFSTKDGKKKSSLPLPATVSKKARKASMALRIAAAVALLLVILSTVSIWRKRALRRRNALYTSNRTVRGFRFSLPFYRRNGKNPAFSRVYPDAQMGLEKDGDLHRAPSTSGHDMDNLAVKNTHIGSEEEHHENSDHAAESHTADNSNSGVSHAESTVGNLQNAGRNVGEPSHALNLAGGIGQANSAGTVAEREVGTSSHSGSDLHSASVHSETRVVPGVGNPNDPDSQAHSHESSSANSVSEVIRTASQEKHTPVTPREPLPPLEEFLESYNRQDFKQGTRPLCRISKPIVLSNGTILLPDWMQKHERILHRCGLDDYSFYPSSTGPNGLQELKDVDADFALTLHLGRFQEPTHVPSVYLTEHILKASFLFDIFSGNAAENAVKETHCYVTQQDTKCGEGRPSEGKLQPGVFVPKRVESGPVHSWPKKYIEMLGKAYGEGHVVHLNASTVLVKAHAKHSENLIGTRFRSILSMDGMFRHIPPKGLEKSHFYSERTGIQKTPRDHSGACNAVIGIGAAKDRMHGIAAVADLKEKIGLLSKFASPGSTLSVNVIEMEGDFDLDRHISEMQGIDLFLAGSGSDMSSLGFLRSNAAVFEIMPFGITPDTHVNLALALGTKYTPMRAKPNTESFKRCLEGEIFSLRKKGQISFTETPDWYDPLMKEWDGSVAEFALTGKTKLDLLTAQGNLRNFHSKLCALKQRLEVQMDDTARKIALAVKEVCGH